MESILRIAQGSRSIQEFAKDVYIKSNLTTELSQNIKCLQQENIKEKKITSETASVTNLCNTVEAILLHGLKEKLKSRVSFVFSNSLNNQRVYQQDFWPVILILCHNDVSQSLLRLRNIATDIGRCRAWLRLTLSDGLIASYLDSLINDPSLLHGFYRSSAYLRDKEHTDLLRHLLDGLNSFVFQVSSDCPTLNAWSWETLKLIGISHSQEEPTPVMPAVDAIQLISEEKTVNVNEKQNKEDNLTKKKFETDEKVENILFPEDSKQLLEKNEENEETFQLETETDEIEVSRLNEDEFEITNQPTDEKSDSEEAGVFPYSSSLNRMSGWSSLPKDIAAPRPVPIKEQSYDDILKNSILSSTPDIKDFTIVLSDDVKLTDQQKQEKPSTQQTSTAKEVSPSESASDLDFEVIPKSVVLNNSDPNTHRFLHQVSKLANECGLDEQDYKCSSCGRPIGMIYGKSRMCHFDGYRYCLECHINDEIVIPSRIIYNWNFRKYPVAKRNKYLLQKTENEPLFDIKVLSPILYSLVGEMKQVLELRTQLFYLHAYLFTCQEAIALELRKLVWPREHLFEHIHLYSTNDLIETHNGNLIQTLRKVISFARKHVASCPLCTLKGYYCEICKSSQILYPFDTDSTKRCEKCKTVFHLKCFIEKYEKSSCPKCLRIQSRVNRTSD